MEENEITEPLCKSVFKNGETTTTEQAFTDIWIELIHALEKGK